MLAKYIPGGIWTPAARIVSLRRAGVTDTALVGAAMFVEASLSAVSGVLVFVVGLRWVHGVDAPLAPLILFAVLLDPAAPPADLPRHRGPDRAPLRRHRAAAGPLARRSSSCSPSTRGRG